MNVHTAAVENQNEYIYGLIFEYNNKRYKITPNNIVHTAAVENQNECTHSCLDMT